MDTDAEILCICSRIVKCVLWLGSDSAGGNEVSVSRLGCGKRKEFLLLCFLIDHCMLFKGEIKR